MNKTDKSAKILKRKKNQFLLSESHQKLISTCAEWGLSFKLNMKQIHKAVHALENDIGFWRPSWILLKKLKIAEKKFTGQISQGQYAYCKYLEIIRVGLYGYITKFC